MHLVEAESVYVKTDKIILHVFLLVAFLFHRFDSRRETHFSHHSRTQALVRGHEAVYYSGSRDKGRCTH